LTRTRVAFGAAAVALALAAFGCAAPRDDCPSVTPRVGAQRPQLDAAQARAYSRERVLGAAGRAGDLQHDGWDPLADTVITGERLPAFQYRVDPALADGRTIFATVQAAVNRAHTDIGAGAQRAPRIYIGIAPGRYRELVFVPAGPVPITLWGLGRLPHEVTIEEDLDAGVGAADYRRRFARVYEAPGVHPEVAAFYRECIREDAASRSCMNVMWVRNDGFQLRHLAVANVPGQTRQRHQQAVAFRSEGADRVHLEQVQLHGMQDTLYLRTPTPDSTVRSFVHRSLIEGDVDFIYGAGTAYFLRSEIRFVGPRRGQTHGWVAAPSTHLRIPYGFVFEDCDFSADGNALPGRVALARQWFTGAGCSPYGSQATACTLLGAGQSASGPGQVRRASIEAVGKMVVLRSRIGAHIDTAQPWAPWQTDPAHRAYRPAQFDGDDFWTRLASAGLDPAALGYARATPAQPWLAEFGNRDSSALSCPSGRP